MKAETWETIEKIKTARSEEEFFIIWNGAWCVGFMQTPGVIPEMDVSVEVINANLDAAISELAKTTFTS